MKMTNKYYKYKVITKGNEFFLTATKYKYGWFTVKFYGANNRVIHTFKKNVVCGVVRLGLN